MDFTSQLGDAENNQRHANVTQENQVQVDTNTGGRRDSLG